MTRLVAVLPLLVAGCGKASTCDRLAERSGAAAAAIEGVILDDYTRFAAHARAQLGRSPPAAVERAAQSSAAQWRAVLTDPLLAETCTTEWPDEQVVRLDACLARPDDPAFASCVLTELGVPRLGAEL